MLSKTHAPYLVQGGGPRVIVAIVPARGVGDARRAEAGRVPCSVCVCVCVCVFVACDIADSARRE